MTCKLQWREIQFPLARTHPTGSTPPMRFPTNDVKACPYRSATIWPSAMPSRPKSRFAGIIVNGDGEASLASSSSSWTSAFERHVVDDTDGFLKTAESICCTGRNGWVEEVTLEIVEAVRMRDRFPPLRSTSTAPDQHFNKSPTSFPRFPLLCGLPSRRRIHGPGPLSRHWSPGPRARKPSFRYHSLSRGTPALCTSCFLSLSSRSRLHSCILTPKSCRASPHSKKMRFHRSR